MVGLLLSAGDKGATLFLEECWARYCSERNVSVLCGYHEEVFGTNQLEAASDINASHTRVLENFKFKSSLNGPTRLS